MGTVTVLPLASGIQQSIDQRLLPDGLLRRAVNVELPVDGRLVARSLYAGVASTVYGSGSLVAYDLWSLDERLVALGDRLSAGYATDVFELTSQAAAWRPSDPINDVPRLPVATRLRDVGVPVDQEGGVSQFDCASGAGCVAIASNSDSGTLGHVHIVLAGTDQTLVSEQLPTSGDNPHRMLRVVALATGTFLIVGANATLTQVGMWSFDPSSDETLQLEADDLFDTGQNVVAVAAAAVNNAGAVAVAVSLSNNTTLIRTFTAGGTQLAEYGPDAPASSLLAVEADATSDTLTIALVNGDVEVYSYDLTTTAENGTGPHTPPEMNGLTCTAVALCRLDADEVVVACSATDTEPVAVFEAYNPVTNAFGDDYTARDLQLATAPLAVGGRVVFGARTGPAGTSTPAGLYQVTLGTARSILPLAGRDLELAGDALTTQLPRIDFDSSRGMYVWPVVVTNEDDATLGLACELSLSGTGRRQAVQVGGSLFLTGGLPCSYGGRALVESGFAERPRIVSVTPSNGSGELLPLGIYSYVCHWEWTDERRRVHRSPVSEPVEVTMGASDDTNTLVLSTPHSMRANLGSEQLASSVRAVVSRTRAAVTTTVAAIVGVTNIDPPSGTLNTLTLGFREEDSAGSNTNVVGFGSGDTTATAILATINSFLTKSTATLDNGRLRIEVDEPGEGSSFAILALDAGIETILGLSLNQRGDGTTQRTSGGNLHRSAVMSIPVGTEPGTYLSVTDLRADQSDPIDTDTDLVAQAVVYTQANVAGGDHSPQPCQYASVGGDRVVTSGLTSESDWQASKLLAMAAALKFGFGGLAGFRGAVQGKVVSVSRLQGAIVLFTTREVWAVVGSGPSLAGQGEFLPAQRIPTDGGMREDGWRSVVEDKDGIWFQLDDDKLYHLGRGLKLEWRGHAVRETLALYPVVTAAARIRGTQSIAFGLSNVAGDDGGILRFDTRRREWFFDDVGAVQALAEHDGAITYLDGGTVRVPTTGYADVLLETGFFQGFQALGYGQFEGFAVLVTYVGECRVRVSFDFSDGDGFQEANTFTLTNSEYTAGDAVSLQVQPKHMANDRFACRVEVLQDDSTQGAWIHAFGLETTTAPNLTRRGNRDRA